MKYIYILFSLIISYAINAEDIKLKNGQTIKNAEIIKEDSSSITIKSLDGDYTINKLIVEKVYLDNGTKPSPSGAGLSKEELDKYINEPLSADGLNEKSITHTEPRYILGLAIGNRWAMAIGMGSYLIDRSENYIKGFDLLFTYTSEKFGSEKGKGDDSYFDWLAPTNITKYNMGYNLSIFYHYYKIGFGLGLEYIKEHTIQNYHSNVTGWDYHKELTNNLKYQVSYSISVQLTQHYHFNITYADYKGVLFGLFIYTDY